MRRVKIEQWCDVCWQNGEQLTESTRQFAVGAVEGSTTHPGIKLLETCDSHAPMLEAFIAMLKPLSAFKPDKTEPTKAATAAVAALKAPPRDSKICPVCRIEFNRASLVTHVWNVHADIERPPYPERCPDCGDRAVSAQGMAAHRRITHGYDALNEALTHCPTYRPQRAAIAGSG